MTTNPFTTAHDDRYAAELQLREDRIAYRHYVAQMFALRAEAETKTFNVWHAENGFAASKQGGAQA